MSQQMGHGQAQVSGGLIQPWYEYSYQQWVPPQRKVTKTITTKEYDEEGRVVKEIVTEEVEEVPGYYRQRHYPQYTYNDYQITCGTGIASADSIAKAVSAVSSASLNKI